MANGQELSSIDFQSMIGGSLNAVIKAQAQSAQTQINKDNVQNLEVKWVFPTVGVAGLGLSEGTTVLPLKPIIKEL
jgi:hypothetical protein